MERFPMVANDVVTPLPRRQPDPRHEPDDDRRVVGFGDHLPAFLTRPRAKSA
jgi:hypothetical protein